MLITVHYEPVYAVCVSPAPVGVRVPVPRVDEGVFERSADVVGRQPGDRRHHVARELTETQRPPILTSPPVMLRPEITHTHTETHKKQFNIFLLPWFL